MKNQYLLAPVAAAFICVTLIAPQLFAQAPRLRQTLEGHSGGVSSVAFSPDGKVLASAGAILATGGTDKNVRLWDASNGKPLATLEGHMHGITSIAFSPDGKWLASSGHDWTLRLWDVRERKEFASVKQRSSVYSLAYSADGRTLGIASSRLVFLADSGVPEKGIAVAAQKSVWALAFSGAGKTAAFGGKDNTIQLIDYTTGNIIDAWPKAQKFGVQSLAFSPNGKILASGGEDKSVKGDLGPPDGDIHLWDVTTGKRIMTLTGHDRTVFSVTFSPDGKTLASGSLDKTVKIWDVASGKNIATLRGHTDYVRSVAFSPDGKTLASGSHDKTIKLWNLGADQ